MLSSDETDAFRKRKNLNRKYGIFSQVQIRKMEDLFSKVNIKIDKTVTYILESLPKSKGC